MIIAELAQTFTAAVSDVVAAAPTPEPKGVNTEGVVSFLLSRIAPIFLAVLGLIFIGRASKGEVSKVVTSSAIAIVGIAFIVGAASLLIFGGYLVELFFT
ncbi:MAG: hypothetical protein ACRDT6_27265 [Micromonosporaceae bacterium]